MVSVEAQICMFLVTIYGPVADLLHSLTLSLHVFGIPLPIYGLTLHFYGLRLFLNAVWFVP